MKKSIFFLGLLSSLSYGQVFFTKDIATNLTLIDGVATVEQLDATAADVTALVGNISNSYVVVSAVKIPFNSFSYDRPYFATGDFSSWVTYESFDEWSITLNNTNTYSNPSQSYYPPLTGWLDSTGGVSSVTVEFFPGQLSTKADASNVYTIAEADAAIESWTVAVVTNPVVATVPEGDTNNVIDGAAVKDAFAGVDAGLAGKASTNGITEQTEAPETIAIAYAGQSNMLGFTGGTNRLFSDAFTPLSTAFISSDGQYSTAVTNRSLYQTNLVYYNWNTYDSSISWGLELPIGHALANAGYVNFGYKAAVGGASPGAFTNGGTYWKYVTNAYEQATNTWSNAPAPTMLVYFRGETGSTDQTAAARIAELSNTFVSAKTYYGNLNLSMIVVGLPGYYYNLSTNAPTVESASRQFCDETPNCYFVEINDIDALHLDQDEMLEAAGRVMVPINKIIAGKKHSQFEQFEKIGAAEVVADEIQVRELKYKSRPLNEAIGIIVEDEATVNGSRINSAIGLISAQTVAANLTAPVYSNGCSVIVRFDGSVTNTMTGGPIVGQEGISAFEWRYPDVGGYTVITNNEVSAYYTDTTTLTNSDMSISYWYRRDFEATTNDTVNGFVYHVFWTNAVNTAIAVYSRTYTLPVSSDNNYKHAFAVRGFVLTGSYAPPLGEWHHYAWVLDRDGTNSTAMGYVDGVLNVSSNLVGDYTSTEIYMSYTNNVGVGARSFNSTRDRACDGALGDFIEYRRVLSEKEIMSLATGQTIRSIE